MIPEDNRNTKRQAAMEYSNLTVHVQHGPQRRSSFRMQTPNSLLVPKDTLPRNNSVPNIALSSPKESPILERVRTFHLSPQGVIDCGNETRRKSAHSIGTNSDSHGSLIDAYFTCQSVSCDNILTSDCFRIAIIGSEGVGKHSLRQKFTSSEELCIQENDLYDTFIDAELCVSLDGQESYLNFVDQEEFINCHSVFPVDAILAVFSLVDVKSFRNCTKMLTHIREELNFNKPIFLVANKADLARKRCVSGKDAMKVADKFRCKYVETSVVLNHNIDELLVGTVRQVRHLQEGSLLVQSSRKGKRPSKVIAFTRAIVDRIKKSGQKEPHCKDLFNV